VHGPEKLVGTVDGALPSVNATLPQANGTIHWLNGALPHADGPPVSANGTRRQGDGSLPSINETLPSADPTARPVDRPPRQHEAATVATTDGDPAKSQGPAPSGQGEVIPTAGLDSFRSTVNASNSPPP
jgi:hypothetical protein